MHFVGVRIADSRLRFIHVEGGRRVFTEWALDLVGLIVVVVVREGLTDLT